MTAPVPIPSNPPRKIGAVPHYQGGQWASWAWIDDHWLDPRQMSGENCCPVDGYQREPAVHLGIEFGLEILIYRRADDVTEVPPFLIEIYVCEGLPVGYMSAGSLPDALDLLGRWSPAVTADVLSNTYRELADVHPQPIGLLTTVLATARANEDAIEKDARRITQQRADATRQRREARRQAEAARNGQGGAA